MVTSFAIAIFLVRIDARLEKTQQNFIVSLEAGPMGG